MSKSVILGFGVWEKKGKKKAQPRSHRQKKQENSLKKKVHFRLSLP